MSNAPASLLGDCIDAIYQTLRNAEDWQSLLAWFGARFPGTKWAISSEQPHARRNVGFIWHGFDEKIIQDYVTHYCRVNPWIPHAQRLHALKSVASDDLLPSHTFRNSEFYSGFIEASGEAESAAGIKLFQTRDRFAVLSVHYGSRMAETYNHALPRLFDALAPHLKNAIEISALIRESESVSQALGALVDHVDGAAFLIDGLRRIHASNAAAVGLLDTRRHAFEVEGRLEITHSAAADRLGQILSGPGSMWRAPLSAPRGPGDPWRFNDLGRSPAHFAQGWLPEAQRWILAVYAPTSDPSAVHQETLAAFGLTRKQIELAQTLMEGLPLATAADRMGVTSHTVRQHLKAIFAKTGTHRQAELVAKLNQATSRSRARSG